MKINFKYIEDNDNQDKIVDKVNINFDQVLFHGIGYVGDIGPNGPMGTTGPIGSKGVTGITGEKASNWYKQDSPPTGDDLNVYDYWINTSPGPTGSDFIYFYDGSSWVFTNETLSKSSIFTNFQEILGAGGINNKDAIIPSNYSSPWKETLVLSNVFLEESNINPNYSKLRLVTSGESELPIFTFSKLNYSDSQPPSIYWGATASENYGLDYRSSGSLRFESGNDLSLLAGSKEILASENGNVELTTVSRFLVNSTGDIYFKSGDGRAIIDLEGSFESKSTNFIVNSTLSKFDRGLEINSEDSIIASKGGGPQLYRPRVSVITSIPSSSVMETSSYSLSNLDTVTESIVLEDFRSKEQNKGEGSFRTEIVRINPDNINLNLPYIKNGFPGATGSYPVRGNNNAIVSYSNKTKSGTQYSVVDLRNSTYYSKRGISLETNNSSGPTGPEENAVWVRVKTGEELNLSGVWSGDVTVPYRFYYRRNKNPFYSTSNLRFGGIIYRRPDAFSDNIITFDRPAQTFELVYYSGGKRAFYRTVDSSGILNMSSASVDSSPLPTDDLPLDG